MGLGVVRVCVLLHTGDCVGKGWSHAYHRLAGEHMILKDGMGWMGKDEGWLNFWVG
jgi:hypothetical protein